MNKDGAINNQKPSRLMQSGDNKNDTSQEEELIVIGMAHWAKGHRREAINAYLAAVRINPDSRAKILLEQARTILNFYSKDLLNP